MHEHVAGAGTPAAAVLALVAVGRRESGAAPNEAPGENPRLHGEPHRSPLAPASPGGIPAGGIVGRVFTNPGADRYSITGGGLYLQVVIVARRPRTDSAEADKTGPR